MRLSRLSGPTGWALLFALYAAIAIPPIACWMLPFQAADELAHAQRADAIALGGFVAHRTADGIGAGGPTHEGLAALSAPFEILRFHPKQRVVAGSELKAARTEWGPVSFASFPNTALYPPFFYLPSSGGFLIGRVLHLGVWQSVVLARLLTGLVAAMLCMTAIALSGGAAPYLFSVLCLPMSFALFGAVSQDGPMIASAALGAVLLAGQVVDRRRFAVGCGLLALVVMARPAYVPFCALPLLSAISWRARIFGVVGMASAAMGWVVVSGARAVLPSASAHIAEQLETIQHHPLLLLHVLINTVSLEWRNGLPNGREFIGVLGWLDTTLPNPYYALAGCVLCVSAVLAATRLTGAHSTKTISAAAILATTVAALYATQYLSWTPIGGLAVEGVQGRYFLPVAALLVIALPGWRGTLPRMTSVWVGIFPLLSIAVTLRAILIRYYGLHF